MRILDERAIVKEAIADWLKRYGLDRTYACDHRGRRVGEELATLNPDEATAADVAEIIGNASWVCEATCGECGVRSWGVVEVGEPMDYESNTAHLCRDCLRAALRLFGEVTEPTQ